MATIKPPIFIKCDRCGAYVQDDSYHARMVLRGGFGDLTDKRSNVITAKDLCGKCEQELIAFLSEPTNASPMDLEERD